MTSKKDFTVCVAYEEGFQFNVRAASELEAEKIAMELVDEHSNDLPENYRTDVVHRDFFVTDTKQNGA